MTDRAIATDNGFRKLATAAAFAGLFSYAVTFTVTLASINEMGRTYHASIALLGSLFFVACGGFLFAVIVGGRMSDRHGKVPVVLAGCLLMAAGTAVLSQQPIFPIVFAALFLMGAGGGFVEGSATAVIADLYAGSRRTAVLNLSQVAFGLGAVAAPIVVARLFQKGITWRFGYVGATVVCAISALIAVAAVRRGRERPLDRESDRWAALLGDRLVLRLSFGLLLYVAAETGQANWLAVYFNRELGSTGAMAALTVAFFWAGIAGGRTAAAWVSKHLSDTTLIAWSLSLAALAQGTLLLLGAPTAAFVVVLSLGFFLGPVWPTVLSVAGEAYPQQSGTVFGIIIAAGALGAAIFPATIGLAADSFGLRLSLWLCFAASVANLGNFLQLRKAAVGSPCTTDQ